MAESYDGILFGMGNPLLDIAAHVTKEFALEKYGAEFGNAILANDQNKGVYEDICTNYEVDYTAGGATMNVCRVFQWMLNRGPGKVTFLGCVGSDSYGDILETQARRDGVDARLMRTDSFATGTCAVLIVDTERCLIANLSAAEKFETQHLMKEEQLEAMRRAQFYYISGFFLTVSPESMLYVAEHALKENKTFMMNLSAMFVCQFFTDRVLALLPFCDYVFSNEDEARALSQVLNYGTDDVLEIAKRVALHEKKGSRPRIVVFTQSSDPVCIAIADPSVEGGVRAFQFAIEALPKEAIVDTNGAGDAFCGGFISQLVQGRDMNQCLKAGCYASSYIIQRSGIQMSDAPSFE